MEPYIASIHGVRWHRRGILSCRASRVRRLVIGALRRLPQHQNLDEVLVAQLPCLLLQAALAALQVLEVLADEAPRHPRLCLFCFEPLDVPSQIARRRR